MNISGMTDNQLNEVEKRISVERQKRKHFKSRQSADYKKIREVVESGGGKIVQERDYPPDDWDYYERLPIKNIPLKYMTSPVVVKEIKSSFLHDDFQHEVSVSGSIFATPGTMDISGIEVKLKGNNVSRGDLKAIFGLADKFGWEVDYGDINHSFIIWSA